MIEISKKLAKRLFGYKQPVNNDVKIREDDIFIVSYPKSGNTWMRFLIGNLISDESIGFKNINQIVPDIHLSKLKEIEKLDSPRFIKSHSGYTNLFPKVIYIYRDPRDVVVSFYYYYKKFHPGRYRSFNFFFRCFMMGLVGSGLWSKHYRDWFNASINSPQNICLVNYEKLKENTFQEFQRVVDFCGLNASDSEIELSIHHSDFKSMQSLEQQQSNDSFLRKSDQNINFVRSGKSDYLEMLSKNQIKEMNRKFNLN